MKSRDKYVAEKKKQLDEWNKVMDTLDARTLASREAGKEKYQAQLAVLHNKMKEGAGKLDAIKSASVDNWENLKSESEKTWNTFHSSLSEFCAKFV
jgi:hypothetical protein